MTIRKASSVGVFADGAKLALGRAFVPGVIPITTDTKVQSTDRDSILSGPGAISTEVLCRSAQRTLS